MATRKKNPSGLRDLGTGGGGNSGGGNIGGGNGGGNNVHLVRSGNVIDKNQLAQHRAEKASPTISKREVDKIFATPAARRQLAVQRDIAAFGSLIRNLRRGAKLTQAELAKESGVSRATIANVEAGCADGGPRVGTIAMLARACGVQLQAATLPVKEPAYGHDFNPGNNIKDGK